MHDFIGTLITILITTIALTLFGGSSALIGIGTLGNIDTHNILSNLVFVLNTMSYFDLVIPMASLLCIYMMWSPMLSAKDPGDDELALLFVGLLVGLGSTVAYQIGQVYFPLTMDGLQYDKAALLMSLLVTILGSITLGIRLRNIKDHTKTAVLCYSVITVLVLGSLGIGVLGGLGGVQLLEMAAKGAGI
jgi:hypothetical protein